MEHDCLRLHAFFPTLQEKSSTPYQKLTPFYRTYHRVRLKVYKTKFKSILLSIYLKSIYLKSIYQKSIHLKTIYIKSVYIKSVYIKSVHLKSVYIKSIHLNPIILLSIYLSDRDQKMT